MLRDRRIARASIKSCGPVGESGGSAAVGTGAAIGGTISGAAASAWRLRRQARVAPPAPATASRPPSASNQVGKPSCSLSCGAGVAAGKLSVASGAGKGAGTVVSGEVGNAPLVSTAAADCSGVGVAGGVKRGGNELLLGGGTGRGVGVGTGRGVGVGVGVARGVGVGVGEVSRGRVRIGASGSTGPWMSVGVGAGVGNRKPPGGASCAARGAPASASAIRLD